MRQDRHRHARPQTRQLGRVAGAGSAARRTPGRSGARRVSSRSASAGDQAALASMRMRGPSPTASRTARTRASSTLGREADLEVQRAEAALDPRGQRVLGHLAPARPGTRSAWNAERVAPGAAPEAVQRLARDAARRGPRARCRCPTAPTRCPACRGAPCRSRRTAGGGSMSGSSGSAPTTSGATASDQRARDRRRSPAHTTGASPMPVRPSSVSSSTSTAWSAVVPWPAAPPARAVGALLRHRDDGGAELGRSSRGRSGSGAGGPGDHGGAGRARGLRGGRRRSARDRATRSAGRPPYAAWTRLAQLQQRRAALVQQRLGDERAQPVARRALASRNAPVRLAVQHRLVARQQAARRAARAMRAIVAA